MTETFRIPIIKLKDNLIVSIQGSLGDRLVIQLKEDITSAIERGGVRGLVIDLSGIDVMDSFISRAIRDIGLVARLMGVRAVISGMEPMVAMTLVEMGMGLESVKAALNLEAALDMLARDAPRPLEGFGGKGRG
ncbi:MAG: STAS domain-containing protein [Deltaproteobacteria bacterium]|nr:STAS domain-containing protein [Deltaproteobacteria bacterium]